MTGKGGYSGRNGGMRGCAEDDKLCRSYPKSSENFIVEVIKGF